MNTLNHLLTAVIIAVWIGAIATFSIQNITLVSFKFLLFESIKFPIGVVLSFSLGMGLIIGSIMPLLWRQPKKIAPRRGRDDDLDEFDF